MKKQESNSIAAKYIIYKEIQKSYESLPTHFSIPHPSILVTPALKKLYKEMKNRTIIMGILNITPDSFSDGGENVSLDSAFCSAIKMTNDGADIIDIGGESTRPGSIPISEQEELERIIPLISMLSKKINIPISVDTYKAGVAEKAIEAGATIINDISAGAFDKDMPFVVANSKLPIILMHINGMPQNMQQNPIYENIILEIMQSLDNSAKNFIKAGVNENLIILDPGIGFGKTTEQNLLILKNLRAFRSLNHPILIGTSRKSTIGKILNVENPKERLEGTAATIAVSIMNGANIIRVHDVKEMAKVAKMTDAMI